MHKILNKILIGSLVAVVGVFVFSALSSDVSAVVKPKDTKSGSGIDERVAQRKKERGTKLTAEKKDRLVSSCKTSQNTIREVRDSYVPTTDSRSKAYNQVDAKLWVIIGGLKFIEFDTFKLEQQRSELLAKFKAYDKNYAQFREALDDSVNINCKSDPTGFQALIETARIYNVEIRNQLNGITSFTTNNIRKTLSVYTENLRVRASN